MLPLIRIDDREGRSGLPEALARSLPGVLLRIERLALGDVEVGERWLIERKAVADFAASQRDGRLADQLARLTAARDRDGRRVALLLEGALTAASLPGLDLNTLREALLAVQCDWRLPLIHAVDVEDAAHWIGALARRESAAGAAGMPFQPPAAAAPPARTPRAAPRAAGDPALIQLAALARVPGLGPNKARTLIAHFGSLHALQGADDAALRAVPGIGPELVQALRRVFPRRT